MNANCECLYTDSKKMLNKQIWFIMMMILYPANGRELASIKIQMNYDHHKDIN